MMARAFEQIGAERIFELIHGTTERRLRHVQSLRRTREAQFLGDRLKVSKMAQFHEYRRDTSMASR